MKQCIWFTGYNRKN